MQLEDLKLAIDKSCEIFKDTEMIVIGSMSILGHDPNPPSAITMTMDVDLYPKREVGLNDRAKVAIKYGEASLFRHERGWYIEALSSLMTERTPPGWYERTNKVVTEAGNIGSCLAPIDLAFNKATCNRDKDVRQVTAMIQAGYITYDEVRKTFMGHTKSEAHQENGIAFLSRLERSLEAARLPEVPRLAKTPMLDASVAGESREIR